MTTSTPISGDNAHVKYLKVVGSGPFRLPGERGRLARAYKEAARLLEMLKEIENRPHGG